MRPRLLIIAVVLCTCGGCQFAYECKVWGIVHDALTGAPIESVKVELLDHSESRFPTTTNANGKFWGRVTFRDREFDLSQLPERTLRFSKEGYQTQEVTFDPMTEPESGEPVTFIVVVSLIPK